MNFLDHKAWDIFVPLGESPRQLGSALRPGCALSSLCAVVSLALMAALGPAFDGEEFVAPLGVLVPLALTHGFFIVLICHLTIERRAGRPRGIIESIPTSLKAGSVLALVIVLVFFPVMLIEERSQALATKAPEWMSGLNELTALVALWAFVTFFALPARLARRFSGTRQPALVSPFARLIALLPWGLLIYWIGLPLQTCTGECWGMFEGGISAFSLLGLDLFLASLSCAVHSAVFDKTEAPELHE